MSRGAFLSEALYEADSAWKVHLKSVRVYKMADGADSKSQTYVSFCYFA